LLNKHFFHYKKLVQKGTLHDSSLPLPLIIITPLSAVTSRRQPPLPPQPPPSLPAAAPLHNPNSLPSLVLGQYLMMPMIMAVVACCVLVADFDALR
jgi:hypothetical protein